MLTSTSNDRIKKLAVLKKSAKARKQDGVFIIEGIRSFRELPAQNVKEVYMTEDFWNKNRKERIFEELRILDPHNDPTKPIPRKCELVSEQVMEKISDTVTPQGVVAVVECFDYRIEDILNNMPGYLLLLENIQDPGNLGTMLRTAEAAGVTGIIMSSNTVDVYNPKVVRSTMGSIFRMPFAYAENITDTVKNMVKKGFKVYAAALEGADSCYKADFTGNTAVIIGNEGNGLSKEIIAAASESVYIPMYGSAESLNASISAAVLLYEGARQRNL